MANKKNEAISPQTEPNPEVAEMIAAGDANNLDGISQTGSENSSDAATADGNALSNPESSQTDLENADNLPPGSEDTSGSINSGDSPQTDEDGKGNSEGLNENVNEFLTSDEPHQTDTGKASDDLSSGKNPDGIPAKPKRTRKKTAGKAETSQTDSGSGETGRDGTRTEALEQKTTPKRTRSGRNVPIMSIDEQRTVETDADKKKNDLLDLVESQKSGKILSGTVQGIETSQDNQNHSFAVIYHGNYKVIIPVSEAVEPPNDYRGLEPDTVLRYMMTKRLGAEVDYIVKGIDTKDNVAIASRVDAMRAKRRQYYFGTDRDGNNLIYAGICAEARVVSVIRSGIFADVFGQEVYIPIKELSYQRLMDASTQFRPGQRILVKILEVERRAKPDVSVVASVKQAAENPYEKALKRYVIGNRYVGTVSMIDTNGVFVALDGGIDCLCSYPKRGRPPRGARVTVRVMGINYKSNRIWGAITHIATPR